MKQKGQAEKAKEKTAPKGGKEPKQDDNQKPSN